jgi:formaldehyde-activating enzyme involved in methanogenesis
MRKFSTRNLVLAIGSGMTAVSLLLMPVSALAASSTSAANTTASQQARLQRLITRGDSEISRRLTSLNALASKISGTTKLTSDDQASLSQEVATEISGLTALKTQLDAEATVTPVSTAVSAAVADDQSIITEYRVYLLVLPKVNLVKTADDQQVAEGKLSTLASNLATRLAGTTNDSALQAALTDMNSKISAAQAISSSVETTVLGLEPSGYTLGELGTYRDQLKTAQTDNQDAVNDAKTIINGLKA